MYVCLHVYSNYTKKIINIDRFLCPDMTGCIEDVITIKYCLHCVFDCVSSRRGATKGQWEDCTSVMNFKINTKDTCDKCFLNLLRNA